MKKEIQQKVREHRLAINDLRLQIRDHQSAIRLAIGGRAAMYDHIIAAYQEMGDAAKVADEFGVSKTVVYQATQRFADETGKQLPRKQRINPQYDPTPIVEAYIEGRTLAAIATPLGISRERVRQIIAAYEKASGTSVERRRGRAKAALVQWTCEHCGSLRVSKAHLAHKSCPCSKYRGRGSRFDDPALLEDWIARRRLGATWSELAFGAGLTKNAVHLVGRAIWMYLRREGREAEVPAIWRGDKTAALESRWPMTPGRPIVPTAAPPIRHLTETDPEDEFTSAIVAGAASGQSAADVAQQLGVTKNKVLGHAWRRGIKFGNAPRHVSI